MDRRATADENEFPSSSVGNGLRQEWPRVTPREMSDAEPACSSQLSQQPRQPEQLDTHPAESEPQTQTSDDSMWKDQMQSLMKGGSESDISEGEQFLTKGAFLISPSHGLSMEKASAICEKMEFKGCFSLTKTATGILFKFSHVDDYQMVYKKGFHKVTGSRFHRKIAIPCRPHKTYSILVYEVPDEVPEEDLRHALYRFGSVVELVRLHYSPGNAGSLTPKQSDKGSPRALASSLDGELPPLNAGAGGSVVRVTLANAEEANALLQHGLDFYGATYFPTELAAPAHQSRLYKPARSVSSVSGRVRELLPVFDGGKMSAPASRLLKPRVK